MNDSNPLNDAELLEAISEAQAAQRKLEAKFAEMIADGRIAVGQPEEDALADWPAASEQDRADFEYERYKERKAERDDEQLYGGAHGE